MKRYNLWAELVDQLRVCSLERRRVTLSSGKESDYFIDCKKVTMTAYGHVLVGRVLLQAIEEYFKVFPDVVVGVAMGGCPLASSVATISESESVQVYRAAYVTPFSNPENAIHGTVNRGNEVIVLEDVITTGRSALSTVDILHARGAVVLGVACLVDRCEGGTEAIRQLGLDLWSASTKYDFVG